MKFSKHTIAQYEEQQEKSDVPLVKQWLNPNELDFNKECEFLFMDEDPFECWEVWTDRIEDGKPTPFRFPISSVEPTKEEIKQEIGRDFVRQKAKYDNKKKGIKKDVDDRGVEHAMFWPIYNCSEKCLQILKVVQPSLQNQIIKTSMLKKYRNRMEEYNHSILKSQGSTVQYTFTSFERDDDFDEESVKKIWDDQLDKGYSIEVLLDNKEPFNPEGNS